MSQHSLNGSGTYANTSIWSVIEPCIGIVSACLPIMSPLLRRIRLPCMGVRRQRSEPSNPKVSWLRSKFEIEKVWPGRFKKLGESSTSETDATTDISLTTRIPRDGRKAVVSKSVISKTVESGHECRTHKDEEPNSPPKVVIQTAEINPGT